MNGGGDGAHPLPQQPVALTVEGGKFVRREAESGANVVRNRLKSGFMGCIVTI